MSWADDSFDETMGEEYASQQHLFENGIWIDQNGIDHNINDMSLKDIQKALVYLEDCLNDDAIMYSNFFTESYIEIFQKQLEKL